MGGDKLWIDLWGRPVWRWSLDRLLAEPMVGRVALVVPPEAVVRFQGVLSATQLDRCLLVPGGERRADSVLAGLRALAEAGASPATTVLVHDAARPAASATLVRAVIEGAQAGDDACIPVLPVADTLTRVRDGLVEATVERDGLGAAQTPQGAGLGTLRRALEAAAASGREPTDEASALVAAGVTVRAVAGEPSNRKLTDPADLPVLRAVLRAKALAGLETPEVAAGMTAGLGFDAHRLEEGIPLRLGGVAFPAERRGLAGHSDGDAALHAVIDALLGAAHLGDVGSLFPSGEEAWRGADSGELLREAARRATEAGTRATAVDLTIVAARPAIGPVRGAMEARIAGLLGIAAERVSVKGTTSDGMGFAGGEGIAAYAVVTVERATG